MTTNSEKTKSNSFFAEWLEKLQQESWQLELLISGLALYGIIELGPMIEDLTLHQRLNTDNTTQAVTGMGLLVAKVGRIIFLINLLVHVICRGLWIGAIGLRYVSNEIEYDALNYSKKFTNYLKKAVGDYDDFIEKLERFCSVLFAFTFLLFLFFMSFILYVAVAAFFFAGLMLNGPTPFGILSILTGIVFLLVGVLVFIDFITLGIFKKIEDETFSKIYFYIYRFYSIVTLSFLYRPLLYNFIDDKYTRRFFFLSIVYITTILIFNSLFTNDVYPHFPDHNAGIEVGELINDNHYDDLRAKKMELSGKPTEHIIPDVSIDQFINSKNHMTFFFRLLKSDRELLIRKGKIDPFRKMGFRLGLFKNIEFEDTYIDSIEQQRKTEVVGNLKTQIELLKNGIIAQNANQKTPGLDHQLDSMMILKKEINTKYKTIKAEYKDGKLGRIKSKLLSYIEVHIDSVSVKDEMNCQFYVHPNFNEKGLLCVYNIEKYKDGLHQFIFEKKRIHINPFLGDSIKINKTILPFYKMKTGGQNE